MNIVLIAISSFMLALSGALIPGPLFTITISESARRGFIAGPLLILGHGLLELSLVLLILLGITPYLIADKTKAAISLTGGIILLVMGGLMLKDAGKGRLIIKTGASEGRHDSAESLFRPVFLPSDSLRLIIIGILGSISNPYWIIWWVTVGLGYLMSAMTFGMAGVIAFFIGHILADLSWYSVISLTVSRGQALIGEPGYRFMLYACGIFLIFFGIWFICKEI